MEEIERLKALLKERKEEYQIFGATSEDRDYDYKIVEKIRKLEEDLLTKERNN